jgi:L-malate glycosyltransferase
MNRPAPVLFVIHSLGHGGMERQVAALARTLDRQQYEPHVAAVLDGFRAEEMRREGISILNIPIRSFFDPGTVSLARYLRRYIRKHGIRLVHMFDPGLSLVTMAAARSCRGVGLLSSLRCNMQLVPLKYRYLWLTAHWIADGVVANSEAGRQQLREGYHFPLARIEVCHNGVDTRWFSPEGRERLEPVKNASLVLGCVSVLRAEKNLEQLIEAFARVQARISGAKLLLMGSGPEEAKLKDLAVRLGAADACCFLPSAADVRGALRSIDIFVLPSLSEGLPNSVMEAMACGCCVIASNVGGCPELIEHGVHGLLVPSADLEALTSQIAAAAEQPEWRQQMAEAGAARMRREFSLDRAACRMGEIYQRHLSKSPGSW